MYSLDSFANYEKHFTVMVYNNAKDMTCVSDEQFIANMAAQSNNQITWNETVSKRVHKAIAEFFETARTVIVGDAQTAEHCRAIYGLDIMFDEMLNPYILECNWSPDIAPFVKDQPQMVKQMFDCLFFDNEEAMIKLA